MPDRIVWAGCLLLFGAGCVFGGLMFSRASGAAATMVDLLGIAASFATIAAAFFAFHSLYQWRISFRYSARFKALKDVLDKIPELSLAFDYYQSIQADSMNSLCGRDIFSSADTEIKKSLWLAGYNKLSASYEDLVVVMSAGEVGAFKHKPVGLKKLVDGAVNAKKLVLNLPKESSARKMYESNVDLVREYIEGMRAEIRKLMKASF